MWHAASLSVGHGREYIRAKRTQLTGASAGGSGKPLSPALLFHMAKTDQPFRDYRLAPDACPDCGHLLDAASTRGDGGPPEPGNLTVCIACASVLAWGTNMRLRPATFAETNDAPDELLRFVRVISAFRDRVPK